MSYRRFRGVFCLYLIMGALAGCGITGSKYIPYAEGGAAAVCPNSLAAFTQNLATVFTAAGCGCHTASAPVIAGNPTADSASFLQAASKRGTAQALVNYLVSGSHSGAVAAGAVSVELDAWASACAG